MNMDARLLTPCRRRANWLIFVAAILLMPPAIVCGLYPVARNGVCEHTRNLPGWMPFSEPELRRVRPSVHHGLWFEFELTNRYGEQCVGYWRAWPPGRAEIYLE